MAKLNVTPCTIAQVQKNLLRYYLKALEMGYSLDRLDAVFLWSSPGIGKSQMTQQMTHEIQKQTKRKVKYVEIRLSECTILELLGLMHRDPETNTIIYDAPPIYDVDDEDTIVLYFFDEMDKAPKQLQSAALHLVLDKKYWQYELPPNSIVIAAGNPENIDGQMFSKFAPELNNRFRHYVLEPDFPAWAVYAEAHDVNHYVMDFLEANQNLLYAQDAGLDHAVFQTPRTWMKVSDYLNLMFPDGEIEWENAYPDIAGYLGMELTLKFKAFCSTKGLLPKARDIVRGKVQVIPKKADLKDAVIKSLVSYIYTHQKTLTKREWACAREYVDAFPEEYAVLFYRNISALELQSLMLEYMTRQERTLWKRKYGFSVNYANLA